MATKTLTTLIDDIDGSEATQTLRFSFEGSDYEIDLNDDHAANHLSILNDLAKNARTVGGRSRKASRVGNSQAGETTAIREWAKSQGIKVSERGRIAAEVVEQYRNR